MQVIDCEQGSLEWLDARAGKVTASCIPDVMSKGRGNAESLTRRKYLIQIVAEILSGRPCENGPITKYMDDGTNQEPFARALYEVTRDVDVDKVGFVLHADIPRYGASPDGLIAKDGGVEIKCPAPHTHIGYILDDVVPEQYQPQMLSGMDCCERPWWDFVSYCPIFPANLRLFVKRLPRDDKRIAEIQDAVSKFNADADVLVEQLKARVA